MSNSPNHPTKGTDATGEHYDSSNVRHRRRSPAPRIPPPQGASVELLSAADVQIRPVCWLWRDWLAQGKLHILAGVAGTGKTSVVLDWAATVSAGGTWPDGSRASAGNALIWSGEDDPEDTLAPRLLAAGADMRRVHFVKGVREGKSRRMFDPARDIGALELAAREIGGASLLMVDPIVSAVATDSHHNAETRRSLQPLVDLGAALGCAVIGISHFSKGSAGRNPVERVTGSVAFGALPRVVLIAARLSQGDNMVGSHLLARPKSNIGPDGGGFHFVLDQEPYAEFPGETVTQIRWCQYVEGTAHELLAEAEYDGKEFRALHDAKRFLSETLSDGPRFVRDVNAAAKAAGISDATLRRAREALGIVPQKGGWGNGWIVALKTKALTDDEGAQQEGVSAFDEDDHLRAEHDSPQRGETAVPRRPQETPAIQKPNVGRPPPALESKSSMTQERAAADQTNLPLNFAGEKPPREDSDRTRRLI